jgi:hypothetical protein
MDESYYLALSEELDAFEMEDDLEDFDLPDEDESYLAGLSDEELELELFEESLDLGEALREALSEEYADSTPEELEAALFNIMDALTPAESLNFTKALRQIQAGAGQALRDPTIKQIAATGLPLAGGAVGTLGGPAGTVVGSALGGAAAKALAGGGSTPSTATGTPDPKPSAAAAGLPAAAKGLVLMNDPAVLKATLAAALGQQGRTSVNGVPVGAVMNMLSTIFGQAAGEADELVYESSATPAYMLDEQAPSGDPVAPGDRAQALYAALLRAQDQHLAEQVDWP